MAIRSRSALLAAAAIAAGFAARQPGRVTIDYPAEGSVFPPDITAPTFLWRDGATRAGAWLIEVRFQDGSPSLRIAAAGERMRVGEIDPRAVAETNELPKLTPEQAAARTWKPDERTWAAVKAHSVERPATIVIQGLSGREPVSSGQVSIRTSRHPVGAPIFYRDVPLMPSELRKGVIKPLAPNALPLIAWRLRNVAEPAGRVLMEGLHTCANCHSFSGNGKMLGMDMDGPQNDKGLYTVVPIQPRTSIRSENVIRWSAFRGKLGSKLRVGFMSQVSPDGESVLTTINPPAAARDVQVDEQYYVSNFKDYRFLQVFYPTRGILACYSRKTGRVEALPGADDPRYVQTDGVWSPDGKYIVFARAEAKDPYPADVRPAEFANDPNETRIRYDLFRIPFNDGKGGTPEPVAGASRNGMSNTFPKVSPDGRWIVYVQCRNGQLMRPDSQLYIVPFEGGEARRMQCNTPLMNSWHSFSPNGRWMVFSSKARSPYTQMYLTHLDEDGSDSPPVLIENVTAANRAVNIPEFVNIAPDGIEKIEAPVAEFYRIVDVATELAESGRFEAAVPEWRKAEELDAGDARVRCNLGIALARTGRLDEAEAALNKAVELGPDDALAHSNLAVVLLRLEKPEQAVAHLKRAVEIDPGDPKAYGMLGGFLVESGRFDEAIAYCRKAVQLDPKDVDTRNNLAVALVRKGRLDEAIAQLEQALALDPGSSDLRLNLDRLRKSRTPLNH